MDDISTPVGAPIGNGRVWMRLALAVVVTFGVLVYSWGRTLIHGVLSLGSLEWEYVALFGAGLAAVAVLTRGLGPLIETWRFGYAVLPALFAAWLAANALLMMGATGPMMSRWITAPLYLPGTLWVFWTAWMFYRPFSTVVRSAVLAITLLFIPIFPALIRLDGLTGDRLLNFNWRHDTVAPPVALPPLPPEDPSNFVPIDLGRTTPDDFPQFLGPQRNGVVAHARVSPDWEKDPPRPAWHIPVGAGWSSFAVVDDYAITQEQQDERECVVCYRLSNGTELWRHSDTAQFDPPGNFGGVGPRATPAIAGGRVFSVGATGLLNCLDGRNGKVVWSIDILADNGGRPIEHGVAASPLVVGDRVIVCPTGTSDASLVAYNDETGERVWRAGKYQASYGSPTVARIAGTDQLLLLGAEGAVGHDLDTGTPLWSFPFTTDYTQNCTQPVVVDGPAGQILLTAGYSIGSVLLEVHRGPEGTWRAREKWRSREMKTKFTSAVLFEGHVYGLDDGMLSCMRVSDGKRPWKKKGRYGHGQVLLAGNLLIVQLENGRVALARADPQEFVELHQIHALSGKTWNNPALAGRFLVVRNDHEARAFELKLLDN